MFRVTVRQHPEITHTAQFDNVAAVGIYLTGYANGLCGEVGPKIPSSLYPEAWGARITTDFDSTLAIVTVREI